MSNGVVLATEQWTSRFKAAHLLLLPPLGLDDSTPDGSNADPNREKDNARTCVRNRDVLGFVGPLNSGAALASEPMLNAAGMVQISPGNTNAALTSPYLRSTLEPATYRHRLAYPTYYRVISTDFLQGPLDAAFMKEKLHAGTYVSVDDNLTYGVGLAEAVQAYGTKIGLRLTGSAHIDSRSPSSIASTSDTVADLIVARHPDAVFLGGFGAEADALLKALRKRGYFGPLVGPDALLPPTALNLSAAKEYAANSFASQYGLDSAALPKSFRQAYRNQFHVPLQTFDGFAYDAANIALNAIYQAATHGRLHGTLFQMRAAILPYVAHVRWNGVTGLTTFDRNGDTRHPVMSMYGVRKGKWVFVGVAPKVTGVSPAG